MGDIINMAKDKRDPVWWISSLVIQWNAERHPDLPVLEAEGRILLWDKEDEQAEEPTVEAGTIRVVKPYLWAGTDPVIAMDDISADYELLASSVLASHSYQEEFYEWFLDTFGVAPHSDPIFIEDIHIQPNYRNPRDPLAAQAVIDAAATFGAADSPIITYGFEQIPEERRKKFMHRGLWDWENALGARPWRNILAAARPQE